jgi:cell division protein ZapD
MLLSFLREKTRFQDIVSQSGFYQGAVEDKVELVRILCAQNSGIYPVVSGSRNRYGVKFMKLNPDSGTSDAVTDTIEFQLSCC